MQNQTYFTNKPPLTLTAAHSCSKEQEKKKIKDNTLHSDQKRSYLEESYSSFEANAPARQTQNTQIEEYKEESEGEASDSEVILTNMWWADLKAALGQRINLEGIVCSVGVFARHRHLAMPHVVVPDIRYIDWVELKRKGFQGVVFDKDNTITVPYSLTLWGPLESSMERCKSVFGNDVAVFSNSAGNSYQIHLPSLLVILLVFIYFVMIFLLRIRTP
ncbi:unnamed protein product [Ilex paraguariensis]|uniref:Uncharacterized protein n=1 Tax=Ilex paraguariensis TaxID=185542 RepID=A0ABC8SWE9_9AQUA